MSWTRSTVCGTGQKPVHGGLEGSGSGGLASIGRAADSGCDFSP
jgi:hypothetical protein